MLGRVLRGLRANATELFRGGAEDSSGSGSGGNLAVLNGVRALACLWVVSFHVLCVFPTFVAPEQFWPLRDHWSLWGVRLGNSAVDVFFVLSGFVLAYPLCVNEFRLNRAAVAAAKKGPCDTSAFDGVSVPQYWYRRFVVRLWPPLVFALVFYCCVLFPGGQLWRWHVLPNTWALQLTVSSSGGANPGTHQPHVCHTGWWPPLLFLTNTRVLESCMNWTWSLAVQAQWYLLFPVLVRVCRRARTLAWTCVALVVATTAWRYHTALQAADDTFPPRGPISPNHDEALRYAVWFVARVAPTGLRLGAFGVGAVAAYVQARVHTTPDADHNNPRSVCVRGVRAAARLPALVHALLCALVLVALVRNNGLDDESLRSADAPVHYAFEYLGGPVFACAVSYVVLCATNGWSGVGRALHRLFSAPVWCPVAKVSYGVYLTHFGVIQRTLSTVLYPSQTMPPTLGFLWLAIAANVALALAVGAVVYVCVEQPAAAALSRLIASGSSRADAKAAQVTTKPIADVAKPRSD